MNFIQKFKTNSKFRWKMILLFIVAVLIAGNYKEAPKMTKTYEQCSSLSGTWMTSTSYNVCRNTAGCYPRVATPGNWVLGVDDILACVGKLFANPVFALDCTNAGADNQYVVATAPNEGCSSGGSVEVGHLCGDTIYECIPVPEDEKCSNDFQTSVAGLANSLMGSQPCNIRFYVVAGGAGFIMLILILAVL